MKPHILSGLFLFLAILFSSSQGQTQPYGQNNPQLNCANNGSSTLGYTCNGAAHSCPTYLTFRSQTNYQTPSQIASFLNSNSASISQLNDIPQNTPIPLDQLVLIPATCSCAGNHYQQNTSYTIKNIGETYLIIANSTYQGLTTCQALIAQNPYDPLNLAVGMKLHVPLRCGCPTSDQISRSGIKYLVTYLITWGDDIHSIAQKLNSDFQSVLDASGLTYRDIIYPFTTLLIPVYTEPTRAQVKSLETTPASPGPDNLSPVGGNSSTRKWVYIGIGIGAGFLIFCGILSWCFCCFYHKISQDKTITQDTIDYFKERSYDYEKGNDIDLPLFVFSAIEAATNHFSAENKLGEGGFGPVYKGKLGEDKEIAVKRLAKTSQQGVEEFKNEVMLIAKLQNRNLVRLLGCCIEGEERILIYEYMPNKGLDTFLFDKANGTLLDWKTRHQIIVGITRGLLYLHHDSRLRIIHRDLKASNILLDMEMNPKISDFGMARIFGGDDKDFNTRKVVGTYGYMAPEYAMEGIFSVKSDVFSYGVLLLEIISGRRNRGDYPFSAHLNLVAHVWSLWKEDKILELVDESISDSFPTAEVLKYFKIGLLCVQEHPEDRPLMSSVIQMLGSEITSLPQPKQPGFIKRFLPLEADSSQSEQGATSNEISFSILEGR